MGNIETGVDRLVQLINKEKKITVDQAAKKLGVPTEVVQEWADFLDEESLISMNYSLSKVYLEVRQLSKKEVEKKEKDYHNKREAFTRKVDTTLKKLEKETTGFEEIKKAYYSLKEEIGDEISQVKDEVDELKHYEELKKSIDQDILQQKVDYEKALGDIHRRISAEEKRYEKLHGEIKTEEEHVVGEKKEIEDLRMQEDTLVKRLDALKEVVEGVKQQLDAEDGNITHHEERLMTLRQLAHELEKDIREKREKELQPLLDSSDKHQKKILSIQDEIIKKIKARKEAIEQYETQGEQIAKRFEKFFERKTQTEKIVTDLEQMKQEMKDELNSLILKAKSYDLSVGGADTTKHTKELEKKFNEFDKKRVGFGKQLEKLRSFIGGK